MADGVRPRPSRHGKTGAKNRRKNPTANSPRRTTPRNPALGTIRRNPEILLVQRRPGGVGAVERRRHHGFVEARQVDRVDARRTRGAAVARGIFLEERQYTA